jgi:tRNA pseudouridine65 synthase
MTDQPLEILFRDQHLIAINKPNGLLVHATRMAAGDTVSCVSQLRDQIGEWVYPTHRLDRKTSGVLLFASSKTANSLMQQQFMNHQVEKTYHAIVRGFTDDEGSIDYPVMDKNGKLRDALTHYRSLERAELDFPSGKFATSRYSLVEVKPVSGRIHQIRKHFAHILHPIIGDRPYGCNKQNRLFLEKFHLTEMMLHARSLTFSHPYSDERIFVEAGYPAEFRRIIGLMGWNRPRQ